MEPALLVLGVVIGVSATLLFLLPAWAFLGLRGDDLGGPAAEDDD